MDPKLPGIANVDEALQATLEGRAPGKRFVNRLVLETSPYLLQHAHNPVNWYPWGDEAFARAKAENKLVLVSIGYSTCHWCHVMEHESFEDEEIAAFINQHYVAVKVDREERPDVDAVYMSAVQLISGQGGWPMTVFTTAERQPIFAGTYFPARDGDRGAQVGFLSLLREVERRKQEAPAELDKTAATLTRYLQPEPPPAFDFPRESLLSSFADEAKARFDAASGGFEGAPKFPRPVVLDALLQIWARSGDGDLATVVTRTLEGMANGGMFDQVGGGFHRYSVDSMWLVPHFEKMLYDNAQLATTYVTAAQAFGREDFAQIARRTLDYLLREMRDARGGFYSATDADSVTPAGHLEEGWFFTWTPRELEDVLGAVEARRVGDIYGVTPEGNFEGRSVLRLKGSGDVDLANAKLYEARKARPAPRLDDKIIAAWNGLAMSAFARAGFVLGDERYLDAARGAARFIRDDMQVHGRLRRTFRAGEARHAAVLDDYTFVIQGLLELFEATGEVEWLDFARGLQGQLDQQFWDAEGGGYFLSAADAEVLIRRDKPDYDGAEPSGNSVGCRNLLRLHQLTDDESYHVRAKALLSAFAFQLRRAAFAVPAMLAALDWFHGEPLQIVVAGVERGPMLDFLRGRFLPLGVRVIAGPDLAPAKLALLEGRTEFKQQAVGYVCHRGVCELPAESPNALGARLTPGD
ncbi:MAG: thioredoxin domain-containing protein [Myxococcota bacterium]|nr:thioredoxin domain-containing protein [Myxococcota bacterium]